MSSRRFCGRFNAAFSPPAADLWTSPPAPCASTLRARSPTALCPAHRLRPLPAHGWLEASGADHPMGVAHCAFSWS
jgi:hypothetical protein